MATKLQIREKKTKRLTLFLQNGWFKKQFGLGQDSLFYIFSFDMPIIWETFRKFAPK